MSRVGAPAAAPVLAQVKVGRLRAGDYAGVWAPCTCINVRKRRVVIVE